ncbi:MAG: transposase [Candidatus Omnitrophota bacterium]
MPRTKRLVPTDLPMHIMSRSNNKQVIFNSDTDKLRYYSLLLNLKNENMVDILHYCIMDNHTHLLIMPNSQTKLGRFMKQVNLSYSKYFKTLNDYSGHLWQGRFKSNIIDTDSYLLQCGKYIELNPIRAGIVRFPQDYKFSSYNYYAAGTNDKLITASPTYLALAESTSRRRDNYINFLINKNEINTQRLVKQKFIGNNNFIQKLQGVYNIRCVPLKRGRPFKI